MPYSFISINQEYHLNLYKFILVKNVRRDKYGQNVAVRTTSFKENIIVIVCCISQQGAEVDIGKRDL